MHISSAYEVIDKKSMQLIGELSFPLETARKLQTLFSLQIITDDSVIILYVSHMIEFGRAPMFLRLVWTSTVHRIRENNYKQNANPKNLYDQLKDLKPTSSDNEEWLWAKLVNVLHSCLAAPVGLWCRLRSKQYQTIKKVKQMTKMKLLKRDKVLIWL